MRLARVIALSLVGIYVSMGIGAFVGAQPLSDHPDLDFGSPPSGRVPLLFNDRHVYVNPDALHDGRVLGALVSGGEILAPLRSMFEQMGATVKYDDPTQTVVVSKEGVGDIRLTAGETSIDIGGQQRPLAVPPVIVGDIVLVPVRVITEALGGYVEWLPDSQSVGIRYLDPGSRSPLGLGAQPQQRATIPPMPPMNVRSTVAPGPAIPVPPPPAETFIAFDAISKASVSNEVTPGKVRGTGRSSQFRAASEFILFDSIPLDFELNIRTYAYKPVPQLVAQDEDVEFRLLMQMSPYRKIYAGLGYMTAFNNFAFPPIRGLGLGIEKLPFLDRRFSVNGGLWYYPNVSGLCPSICAGGPYTLSYRDLQYDFGATYLWGKHLFLDAGFLYEHLGAKYSAPSDITHSGMRAGLGVHL